jgi:predicted Rossmann-fold nucleotide-binding protein
MEENKNVVRLSDEEAVRELVIHSVFDLWKVVNNLTRLRQTKREHYCVSIFGSARDNLGSFVNEQVKQLAKDLANMGCEIITGGGPGLMQAANEGASEAK